MGRRKKKSVVQAASNSNDPGNGSEREPIKLKNKLKEKKQLGSGKQNDHEGVAKKQPQQMSRKVNHVENNSNDPGDSQTGKAQKRSAAKGSDHEPIRLKIKLP